MKQCSVEGCEKKHCAKSFCDTHYRAFRVHGDPLGSYEYKNRKCIVGGCDGAHESRGFCIKHYSTYVRGNVVRCLKCDKPRVNRGLCSVHWGRLRRHGDADKILHEQNPSATCSVNGCNKPYAGKGLCQSHYMKSYNAKQRLTVYNHYCDGDIQCKRCGIKDMDVLTIDHINNDGARHRQEIGGSHKLIQWILRNNFPPEFQILCQNCNIKKARS